MNSQQKTGLPLNRITKAQALLIIGDKIGIAEQQRMIPLFEQSDSNLITFEEFYTYLQTSYEMKDDSILEAAFNDLDTSKRGYLESADIGFILKNHQQLSVIRGDGYRREMQLFLERNESGRNKRLIIDDFKRAIGYFNVKSYITEYASSQ